ncbi:MAG: hypothetical protein V4450_06490 [Bacteroidota bacterium]
MRKLLSAILLFCLVIYIGGYHLIYALYKQSVKTETRIWLSDHTDALLGEQFSFTQNGNAINDPYFEWEEVNTEFRYHGELYDVVRIHYNKGQVDISALKDGKENELNKQLSALDIHKQDKQKTFSVLKFFSVFVSCESNGVLLPENSSGRKMPAAIAELACLTPQIASPPPRC